MFIIQANVDKTNTNVDNIASAPYWHSTANRRFNIILSYSRLSRVHSLISISFVYTEQFDSITYVEF